MSVPAVDLSVLQATHDELCRRRVKYSLGAKAPSLGCALKEIKAIDCSGLVRLLLSRATGGVLVLPDGSWHQKEWADKNLRKLAKYADVEYAAEDPSRLFVAFLPPGAIRKGSAGHVWCVRAGRTIESRSAKGPSSRAWDSDVLLKHACACYELPTKP